MNATRHSAADRTHEPQDQQGIDRFRAQHLAISRRDIHSSAGRSSVLVDDAESPLAWLARRRGRGGATLIDAAQFEAGERLRADFTFGQLMPRTTSDWSAAVASTRRGSGGGAAEMTEAALAARQRVGRALDAVGPEFAGVLLDVCCFLKGLEDVERERRWPLRSAKVVLQLALDALARHYGYRRQLRGRRGAMRAWVGDDASLAAQTAPSGDGG
jgi:hypothetical protein